MFYIRVALLSLFWVTSLGGCANHGSESTADRTDAAGIAVRPFPADTLYALLVAEFAGARQQPDIAVRNYTEQAAITQDPGVARQATLVAQYLGADQDVLDNAALWSSLDPHADEADAVLAEQMLKQGRHLDAFDYSLKLLKKGYKPQIQSVAAQSSRDTAEQRKALHLRFDEALATYPDNDALLLGKAILMVQQNELAEALHFSNKAIAAEKNNASAHLLSANILERTGKNKEAAAILASYMNKGTYDQHVHLQYARLLAQYDLKAAQKQFDLLVTKNPFDAELLLALAIVSKEAGDVVTAKKHFEQLLFIDKHTSSANFYLGQISEANGETLRAMEHFRRVSEGDEYFFAIASFCRLASKDNNFAQCLQRLDEERVRLPAAVPKLYLLEATLLHNRKDYSRCLATLNHALDAYPDDLELLYSRSMAQEALGHLTEAEGDLRAILAKDADNANALNALGYMLANKTGRLQEAYELIGRALALEPENPAITDSMGWVLYRMNRHKEALPYLQKAMTLMPNHEIAAHLGEVLWVMGKQKEARKIWMQGIDDDPDSDVLKETITRLKAQ